jgi:uracil-DNA glycosylase
LIGRSSSDSPKLMHSPRASLATLAEDIRACRVCRDAPQYGAPLPHEPRPVFQVSPSARICIAGQAPGVRVHASGRPYTDPSGVRLRNWLGIGEDIFYDPKIVAVVAMGFCFPGLDSKGGDLPPRRECAEVWREKMFALLPNLELILLVGQYAQRWRLGPKRIGKSLSETVAGWRDIYRSTDDPRLVPMPHPSWRNNAWLTRNPWFETELLPVLRADIAGIVASTSGAKVSDFAAVRD